MLGLATNLAKGGAALLNYVKDNLKLYLDFKSTKSDTLKFPCEGSTDFELDSTQYIKISHSTDLSLGTNPHTIACWAKFESLANYRTLIAKRGTGTDYNLSVGSNGEIYTYNGSATAQSANSVISTGIWYHIALVYSGSAYVLYVDGVVKSWSSGTTTSGSANTDDLYIGWSSNSSEYMDGKMANVGIWSRDLSLEEINSVMRKNYSQLKPVEKTSLVSWWALDTETLSDNLATGWTSSDAETLTTSGANITSLVNSDGHANAHIQPQMVVRYRVYKVSYDYTLVSGDHPFFFTATNGSQDSNVSTSATMASLGSSWYFTAGTATGLSFWRSSDFSITVDNFSIKAVTSADSHGSNTGYYSGATASNTSSHNSATTTTSVYGGNAPVLPRAVDVAREGEAEQIGDGSALFNNSSDYIQVADSGVLDAPASWTLSAWIKLGSGTSGYDRIVGKQTTGSQCNYGIGLKNGTDFGVFIADSGGFDDLYYATDLTVGEWAHGVGTWDGTYLKVYLNGILVSTSSDLSSANSSVANTAPVLIGRNATDGNQYFGGNLSQVGIWQGALTQAQIQSVMESTSYAKIPADVKSTLGSELITFSVTDSWTGSNVSVNEASTDYAYSGTQSRKYTTSASGGVDGITSNTFTTVLNSLYKLDCWVYSPSQGDITVRVLQGDGSGYSLDEEVTIATGSWVNIIRYFKELGGGASSEFFVGNNLGSAVTQYVDNVSVKLVTNDLVGYWALDDDNSNTSNGAGITNDLTTGETLSSELVGDASFDSGGGTNITISNATDTEVTGGALVYTDGSASDVTFLKSSGNILTSGNIYKLVFTIADTASHGRIKITFDENSATGSSYSDHQNYANGTHTLYTVAGQANAVINISASSPSFKMTDVSIKEVTSNTGVLK